jgi:hypothetical protein
MRNKSLLTISTTLLLFAFTPLVAHANFEDVGSSNNNVVSAATLDIGLYDKTVSPITEDLFDGSPLVTPVVSEDGSIIVKKEGVLDFKYFIKAKNMSGDTDLCNVLNISVEQDSSLVYDGRLTDLDNQTLTLSGSQDFLDFEIYVGSDANNVQEDTCNFDLVVRGFQTDSDGTWGFIDEEIIEDNVINSGVWATSYNSGDILINEIMWSGSSEHELDEWVELKNTTGEDIALTDWTLEGAAESSHVIELSGIIGAGDYYLLTHYDTDHSKAAIKDSISPDLVDNSVHIRDQGEVLRLKDPAENEIDRTPNAGPSNTGWAAGEAGKKNKPEMWRSMERNDTPGDGSSSGSWHTCIDTGCNDTVYWDNEGQDYGTPKADNRSENDPTSKEVEEEDVAIEPELLVLSVVAVVPPPVVEDLPEEEPPVEDEEESDEGETEDTDSKETEEEPLPDEEEDQDQEEPEEKETPSEEPASVPTDEEDVVEEPEEESTVPEEIPDETEKDDEVVEGEDEEAKGEEDEDEEDVKDEEKEEEDDGEEAVVAEKEEEDEDEEDAKDEEEEEEEEDDESAEVILEEEDQSEED